MVTYNDRVSAAGQVRCDVFGSDVWANSDFGADFR
jgi:hypothetical protein